MYMARTTETVLVELWGGPLKKKRKTIIERRHMVDLTQDARHYKPPQDALPSVVRPNEERDE